MTASNLQALCRSALRTTLSSSGFVPRVRVARQPGEGRILIEAHIIEPLDAYDIVDLKLGGRFLRARTTSGFVPGPGELH
jgi:hypothetical protein